jgi:hypothetical protein
MKPCVQMQVVYLPTPERPVRERDVQRGLAAAVPKQRRQLAARVAADDGQVLAVEHDVEVRDAAGVAPEQLQDAPLREHVPGLEAPAEPRHVEAARDRGHAELGGVPVRALHGVARDPRVPPRPQVLVDPPEVGRAVRRGLGGRGCRLFPRRWCQVCSSGWCLVRCRVSAGEPWCQTRRWRCL